MDYLVVIVGAGVLIAVIVIACVCFPSYRSEEEWERIEKERDIQDAKDKKKREEENMMMEEEKMMMEEPAMEMESAAE